MKNYGESLSELLKSNHLSERYEQMIDDIMKDSDVQAFIAEHRDQLSDSDISKSYTRLYEFINEKKKYLENSEDMIAPGYEPRLFLNFHSIDVTYVPTKALLARQKEEEMYHRVQAMDMPKDIREARLDRFERTIERQEALMAALNFIAEYSTNPKAFHRGLYLQGSFGVGKTYLLGAIAHELAENGFQITIVHFPTLAVEMKNSIGKHTTEDKLKQIKQAPILMLDDIGADSMSSWIRDDVLGVILQYRMQEQLPTFFSSNFSMKQLEEEHLRVTQRGEDEPLKARRIMERIRYLSQEIQMVGKNRRQNP